MLKIQTLLFKRHNFIIFDSQFRVMKKFLFYTISLIIILFSCGGNKETDFSPLKKNIWYSAQMPDGKELYISFTKNGYDEASGICFFDESKAIINKGNFEIIKSKEFVAKISNEKFSYKGNFTVKPDSLIFNIKKPEKSEVIFISHPINKLLGNENRYKKPIFEVINRKSVKYGKANGFYKSKHVDDMNSESYPDIILSVIKSIAKNLFTTELSLDMDIYQPREDIAKYRPLIMLIHGGAFIVGDKRDDFQVRLAKYYAKMGYVVVSINYRMGYVFLPGAYGNMERCIYRAVQDSRAAIRYMIHYKKKYHIDPNKIFVAGNSAGGFIALKTAFMNDDEAYESTKANLFMLYDDLGCLDCSTNDYKEDIKIDAVINMWGALTDIDILDKNEQIPTLLIHGDSDRIVPYDHGFPFKNIDNEYSKFFINEVYGSEPIYEKMQEYGIPSKLITIENGPHEPQFDNNNRYTKSQYLIQDAIRDFLFQRLSGDSLIISGPTEISASDNTAFYSVNAPKNSKVEWIINGGMAIPTNKNGTKVKVFWFKNSDSNSIMVRLYTINELLEESNSMNITIIQ